jgi:hypothetical protein
MGVTAAGLETLAITNPYEAVTIDVAALKANPKLRAGFAVTALVYDITTGAIEVVIPRFRCVPAKRDRVFSNGAALGPGSDRGRLV